MICSFALPFAATPFLFNRYSVAVSPASGIFSRGTSDWPMFGYDLASSHYNPAEKILTPANQYTNPETKLSDAILALELSTGKLVWSHQATPGDRWTSACRNGPECGPDFDFGTIPIAFKGPNGKQLIGAGQKSGWFYALDPVDGKLVCKTHMGPGVDSGDIVRQRYRWGHLKFRVVPFRCWLANDFNNYKNCR